MRSSRRGIYCKAIRSRAEQKLCAIINWDARVCNAHFCSEKVHSLRMISVRLDIDNNTKIMQAETGQIDGQSRKITAAERILD